LREGTLLLVSVADQLVAKSPSDLSHRQEFKDFLSQYLLCILTPVSFFGAQQIYKQIIELCLVAQKIMAGQQSHESLAGCHASTCWNLDQNLHGTLNFWGCQGHFGIFWVDLTD